MTLGETSLKQAGEAVLPVEQPAVQEQAPAAQTETTSQSTQASSEQAAQANQADEAKAPAAEPSEENLRRSLEKVIDPELHMNIVELGLVYGIELIKQGGPAPDVEVEMTLTSPGCPYGPAIMSKVPLVLKDDFGDKIAEVSVNLTFTPPWDPATMASEDVQFELGIF